MDFQISAERLSELVGAIYDCVLASGNWLAVIDAVRCELGFANGVLSVTHLPHGGNTTFAAAGLDPASLAQANGYGPEVVEIWGGPARIRQYPLGEPIVLSQVSDCSKWKRNRYFVEWVEPRGLADCVVIGIARGPAMLASLSMGRQVLGPRGRRSRGGWLEAPRAPHSPRCDNQPSF